MTVKSRTSDRKGLPRGSAAWRTTVAALLRIWNSMGVISSLQATYQDNRFSGEKPALTKSLNWRTSPVQNSK